MARQVVQLRMFMLFFTVVGVPLTVGPHAAGLGALPCEAAWSPPAGDEGGPDDELSVRAVAATPVVVGGTVGADDPKGDPFFPVGAWAGCGDLDFDCDVDSDDYAVFLAAFGRCGGDETYIPEADADNDGCITLADYQSWIGCFRSFEGQATGACCLDDGSCLDVVENCCLDVGGSYGGDATLCGSVSCPPAEVKACCNPSTAACELKTEADCASTGGVWLWRDDACQSDTCQICCLDNGLCTFLGSFGTCDDPGVELSVGEVCEPAGACTLVSGDCIYTGEACCLAQGGRFTGEGTACTCSISIEPLVNSLSPDWIMVLGIARPSPNNRKYFKATVNPPTVKAKIKFVLVGTSSEKGQNMNTGSSTAFDLTFERQAGLADPTGTKQEIVETSAEDGVAVVTVTAHDYGAFGSIKAVIVEADSCSNAVPISSATIKILRDEIPPGGNDIPDEWDQHHPAPLGGGTLAGTDDTDRLPEGQSGQNLFIRGDWLTRYEEYRGFTINGTYETTDPRTKDLFYVDVDNIGQTGDMTDEVFGGFAVHKVRNNEVRFERADLEVIGQPDEPSFPQDGVKDEFLDSAINPNRGHFSIHRQRAIPVTNSDVTGGDWGVTATAVPPNNLPDTVKFCRVFVSKLRRHITTSTQMNAGQNYVPVNANTNPGDANIAWQADALLEPDDELINCRKRQTIQATTQLFATFRAASTVMLVNRPEGSIKTGTNFVIIDGSEQVEFTGNSAFSIAPVNTSTLNGAILVAAVVLNVADASQFNFSDLTHTYVVIDEEQMKLTGVNVAPANTITVVRGANGSVAAPHANGAVVTLPNSFTGVSRHRFGTAAANHDAGRSVSLPRCFYDCDRGVGGTVAAAHGAGTSINYFSEPDRAITMTFAHESTHAAGHSGHLAKDAHFLMKNGINPGAWDFNGLWHTHDPENSIPKLKVRN